MCKSKPVCAYPAGVVNIIAAVRKVGTSLTSVMASLLDKLKSGAEQFRPVVPVSATGGDCVTPTTLSTNTRQQPVRALTPEFAGSFGWI
jgi:hypothetical protein